MRKSWIPILLLLSLGLPSQALAQEAGLGEVVAVLSTTALTPFSTSYLLVGMQAKGRTKELEESVKRLESIVRLERYLQEHERDVRLAIALGAGPSIAEMATLMGVATLDRRVLRALRADRSRLDSILDIKAKRTRAAALYDALHPMFAGLPARTPSTQGRL